MALRRWRDELDGSWHESGDLDQWDVEQDALRMREERLEHPLPQRRAVPRAVRYHPARIRSRHTE